MRTTFDLRRAVTVLEDGTVVIKDVPDASEIVKTAPGVSLVTSSIPIGEAPGVKDHWIALCKYITTSSGDACYGNFSAWANTQSGRESWILGVFGGFVFAVAGEINGLDIIRITSSVTTNIRLINSGGNSDYTYLHASKGWFAIVWKQTSAALTEEATLFDNSNYGTEADGSFLLYTEDDADATPNALKFSIRRGVSLSYINAGTGAIKVKLADWNYAVISWEEATGRDGLRINLNGTDLDFDNTIFSGTPSANPPVLDITMGIRANTGTNPRRLSEMDIVELGAGNVGLTNAEITAITNYIQSTYAL